MREIDNRYKLIKNRDSEVWGLFEHPAKHPNL